MAEDKGSEKNKKRVVEAMMKMRILNGYNENGTPV